MGVELFGVDRPGGPAGFDLAWETWYDVRELAWAFGRAVREMVVWEVDLRKRGRWG